MLKHADWIKIMENSKPVRVLHVLGGLSLGGAESRIMDLYREIDRSKIQFDFLVHSDAFLPYDFAGKGRTPEFYDREVEELGGHIYVLPKFRVHNLFFYRKMIRAFFKEHQEFLVVQGHMTSTAALYLPIAKRSGVKIAAAHARSAGVDRGLKGLITRVLRLPLLGIADACFACSEEAGVSVYGKKWIRSGKALILPNAIPAHVFRFDEAVREQMRSELSLDQTFVLGHVGRFHYAKNHEYLLEVFAHVKKLAKQAGIKTVLLLLGEGSGMQAAKDKAAALGIAEEVRFLGNKKEVYRYYQAMDFFVFPSRFEGLPGTVVEAQAAGLACIVSDAVTKEVKISPLVAFESIETSPEIWAHYIMEHARYERKDMTELVIEEGFDVKSQAAEMEEFYMEVSVH